MREMILFHLVTVMDLRMRKKNELIDQVGKNDYLTNFSLREELTFRSLQISLSTQK